MTESDDRLLKRHEGLRLFPYLCPSGKTTIGWGRNLTDRGITNAGAGFMLHEDIAEARRRLLTSARTRAIYMPLSTARKIVLVDMAVNLGFAGLLSFRRMWSALSGGDFREAANEILDSQYARQLPERSEENAGIMVEPAKLAEVLALETGLK